MTKILMTEIANKLPRIRARHCESALGGRSNLSFEHWNFEFRYYNFVLEDHCVAVIKSS